MAAVPSSIDLLENGIQIGQSLAVTNCDQQTHSLIDFLHCGPEKVISCALVLAPVALRESRCDPGAIFNPAGSSISWPKE